MNRKYYLTIEKKLFRTNDLKTRSIIFIIITILLFLLCLTHGLIDSFRTKEILDEMIKRGEITGAYWKVLDINKKEITVKKYEYIINIEIDQEKLKIHNGDRISFIAKKEYGDIEFGKWTTIKNHLHGKSNNKFILSAIAIFINMYLIFKYFKFEKNCISLKSKY